MFVKKLFQKIFKAKNHPKEIFQAKNSAFQKIQKRKKGRRKILQPILKTQIFHLKKKKKKKKKKKNWRRNF